MDLTFDITEDELPIFMAEVNEQIQILDEGLVRLERSETDNGEPEVELIQALFRAAHTLKGSAGMIDHKRMVSLTHAMETVMDGVRKNQLPVTPVIIDACLESVDVLRFLCEEVSRGESNPVDIVPLVNQLLALAQAPAKQPASPPAAKVPASSRATPSPLTGQAPPTASSPAADTAITIWAKISADSIASAARAFQIVMALQDNGKIISMMPDQATIDTSAPVAEFYAELSPSNPNRAAAIQNVQKALLLISEIERLVIAGEEVNMVKPTPPPAVRRKPEESMPKPAEGTARATEKPTLDTSVEERTRARLGDKTIRTSVERLDMLMNLVGELITDRNRLYMIRTDLETRFRGDNQVDTLSETVTHIGRITDQLQAEVMGIRMLPISNVFNKFPRMVRDLARKANKQIDLTIKGEDTELDRSVIEEISDPLIHLLRNSVDHGIESPEERRAAGKSERGTILLTARHEQGRIILTVEDDGKGIDVEKVKAKAIERGFITDKEASAMTQEETLELIFVSGLSTARVVSDVSGRGVGMDIVRNNIERLNGSILLETWPGRGTQFQIVLPLTLAIVPTLLVRVGKSTFAIPLVTVTETRRVGIKEIQTINGRPVILLRDHVLPIIQLSDVFDFHQATDRRRNKYVVVVRSGKTQMGLIVDALIGEQEVVVKSLSSVVGDVTGISSAAILGDGQVALIVDVQGLFKLAQQYQHTFTRQESEG